MAESGAARLELTPPDFLLAIPTRKLKLEQIALRSASSDRQQELVSTEHGLWHPRFTNEPTLTVDSEPGVLHRAISAPSSKRHVRDRGDDGRPGKMLMSS